MSEGKGNMEEFLREKLNDLESDFQNDWDVFEQKLERALFFKRLRVGAALAVFLIATSIGIFGTSSIISIQDYPEVSFGIFNENGYQSAGSQSGWEATGTSEHEVVVEDITGAATGLKNTPEKEPLEDNGNKNNSRNLGTDEGSSEPLKSLQESVVAKSAIKEEPVENLRPYEPGTPSNEEVALVYESAGNSVTEISSTESSLSLKSRASSVEKSSDRGSDKTKTGVSEDIRASTSSPSGNPSTGEEAAYTSLEEYQRNKEEPINTRTMKLELQPLTAMAGEGALAGLQVRMPAPSFKAEAKSSGPFISPLEGKSPWEFSIKVYPNFTFRKFKVDEDKAHLIHRDFIDQVRVSESGGFSLNIGFEVSRRIGPATYLNSGLEYISYKTSANFDFINYRTANIDPNTGAIMSYSLMEEPEEIVINDQNTYHYLNIPLSIAYKPWASEHIRLNVEAGVSYMHFVTASGRSIDYRTLEVIELSGRTFKSSMGSLNLRVGATYYISPQFNLGFEPTFVYFTNTIYTEEYPFEVIPYSVGLNLKLQVKLN